MSTQPSILPQLLGPGEVAALTNLTAGRITRMAKRGELPHLVMPDGGILFDAVDVAAWIRTCRRPAPAGEAVADAT
jgi:hypothetical protein